MQENITEFTSNLNISTETNLIDKLIEKDCLSENDYEAILNKKTTADQVRLLIRKIKDRGCTVIETFLDVLNASESYKGLALKVKKSANILSQQKSKIVCIVCLMTNTVDIKEIVDTLWKNHIISDDMHGKIAEAESVVKHRSKFWIEVIASINATGNTDSAPELSILKDALNEKYAYIVTYLNGVNTGRGPFGCCCYRRRNYRPHPSESFYRSEDEYSTTSKQNLPSSNLFRDNDSQSDSSSMELHTDTGLSFEKLAQFSDIRNKEGNGSQMGIKARHKSGDFIPSNGSQTVHDADPQCTSLPFDRKDTDQSPDSNHPNEKPKYNSSTSSVKVLATNTSSSGDISIRLSSNSDAMVSPDITVNQIKFNNNVETTGPVIVKSCTHTTGLDLDIPPTSKTEQSMDGDEAFADAEEEGSEVGKQKNKQFVPRTRLRRRNIERIKDVPLTDSRPLKDNASKIGTRIQPSRKSKQSKGRMLRRQKSHKDSDDIGDVPNTPESEDPGMKKPYNHFRDKIPTPKLTPTWDYNQVKRNRKILEYLTKPDRDGLPTVRSDTDFRTEGSEQMTNSDCNYTM